MANIVLMALKNTFSWNFATRIVSIFKKTCIRCLYTIQDKNSEYFRNNQNYKTSVVQRSIDLDEYKIAGPGFSFFLQHDTTSEEIFSHLKLRENVMKLSNDQLKDILCLIANMKADLLKNTDVLRFLDEKCALSVERWSIDLSLYIMDAWFLILGPKAFRKHYYSAVTSVWSRKLSRCTKNHVVQILYYIGMSKSPSPFLMENFEDRVETFMNNLLDEELAIALISFFKTSTRINSQLILSKSCQVAENFLKNDNRFQLINVLKCLRHAKFYDEPLWMLLSEYILKHHTLFNFVECTNFLAAYAAQSSYDEHIFKCLEIEGTKLITAEEQKYSSTDDIDHRLHPSVRSRVKDFAKFLWSLTSMGHSIESENLIKLCELLSTRIKRNEFQTQPHLLVDCMQSLALTDCYPEVILSGVLNPQFFKTVSHMLKDKPKYQFYFVQKCVLIECPYLKLSKEMLVKLKDAFHPIPKNLTKEVTGRKGFQTLVDILKQNIIPIIVDFKCCYIVPHIMIAGIVLYVKHIDLDKRAKLLRESEISGNFNMLSEMNVISPNVSNWIRNTDVGAGSCVCIEILDPSMCACNSTDQLGLIKTKIRQLKKMKFNVIALSSEEIIAISKMIKSEQCNKITSILNQVI